MVSISKRRTSPAARRVFSSCPLNGCRRSNASTRPPGEVAPDSYMVHPQRRRRTRRRRGAGRRGTMQSNVPAMRVATTRFDCGLLRPKPPGCDPMRAVATNCECESLPHTTGLGRSGSSHARTWSKVAEKVVARTAAMLTIRPNCVAHLAGPLAARRFPPPPGAAPPPWLQAIVPARRLQSEQVQHPAIHFVRRLRRILRRLNRPNFASPFPPC